MEHKLKNNIQNSIYVLIRWCIAILLIGTVLGLLSAFFLIALDLVTNTREGHQIFIWLLPLGGLLIGYLYHLLEKGVEGGNERLLQEMILTKRHIHWKMAPLVFFGTLITHLFGGSAGRESTAVQMGGTLADQITKPLKLITIQDRKTVLRMGVAAGFSGVFGTPFAAFIFAFEWARDKKFVPSSLIPILAASFLANYICHSTGVAHAVYPSVALDSYSAISFWWIFVAGIFFGLAALLFNVAKSKLSALLPKIIRFMPLRVGFGGVLLLLFFIFSGTTKYFGLGVPIIQSAFVDSAAYYDWFIKLLLTVLTVSVGFKGGEATPLFFIGATLGSALVGFLPLDIVLLAACGFLAVFAGATNTPIACTIMGAEIFGWSGLPYYLIACVLAYVISGNTSAYSAQQTFLRKISLLQRKTVNK
ncbi:MAG: chloride channel protein [Crocinitomicaceae bacterium]|nr:chloride channel protein [Crocinitomicaceae bacterium]